MKISTGPFALVTLISLGAPAPAQQRVLRDDLPPPPPRVIERAAEEQLEVSLAGQVLRTKQVDLRGASGKVLVALIDLGDERRQIVDLGPVAHFRRSPIYTGDQIAVRGPRVTLGNANVLLATEARVSGDLVVIPRDGAAPPSGYFVSEPLIRFEGKVENLKNVRLRGSRADHLVAELIDRNGGTAVVDLGPPAATWQADLKAGDWITVRGQRMEVSSRPIILAREVNKTGVPIRIARELVPAELSPTELAPAAAVVERVIAP